MQCYIFIIIIIIDVNKAKMLLSYNVQSTNLIFVGKKIGYTINGYSIAQFQIVSDTSYNIQCNAFFPPHFEIAEMATIIWSDEAIY